MGNGSKSLRALVLTGALILGTLGGGALKFTKRCAHAAPESPTLSTEEASERLVRTVWDTAVSILSDKTQSLVQKKEAFRQWIGRYFGIEPSARFAVRSMWKKFSPDHKKVYLKLFLEDLVNTYYHVLEAYYANDELVILKTKTTKDASQIYVLSEIKRTNGQTIPIKWRVRGNKVLDVTVAEANPSRAKFEEYREMIRKNGSTIEGFLKALERKVQAQNSPHS